MTANSSLADIGQVGYGLETTEGVIVAPTIALPVNSFDISSTNTYITPRQIRGSRDVYVKMPSAYSVSGTMAMELASPGVGPLWISALSARGGVTTSAYSGGGYQHVLVPGNDSPTFSFETSAADILIMQYGGIRINTLDIHAAFDEIVTASFGLEGTTRAKKTVQTKTSLTGDTTNPFHFIGASAKLGGVAMGNVKLFDFTLGSNIDRVGVLNKTRAWNRTNLGARDVGLTATFDFQNGNDYDHFLAEDEFDVEIHLEGDYIAGTSGPKHTVKIAIPRVSWRMVNAPLTAGSLIEQAVEAVIVRKMDQTPVVTVTLVTTDATLLGAS